MREASDAGARLVQFPKGAITYPSKYVMSSGAPGTSAAADWSRVAWDAANVGAGTASAEAGLHFSTPAAEAAVLDALTPVAPRRKGDRHPAVVPPAWERD